MVLIKELHREIIVEDSPGRFKCDLVLLGVRSCLDCIPFESHAYIVRIETGASRTGILCRLTFELSGGEAVRLNEGLGVTDGGQARYGLNATDPAAARLGAAKTAPTFTERQRPLTD